MVTVSYEPYMNHIRIWNVVYHYSNESCTRWSSLQLRGWKRQRNLTTQVARRSITVWLHHIPLNSSPHKWSMNHVSPFTASTNYKVYINQFLVYLSNWILYWWFHTPCPSRKVSCHQVATNPHQVPEPHDQEVTIFGCTQRCSILADDAFRDEHVLQ